MKITKNNQKGRLLLTNSFFIKMVQMRRCFQARCTKPVHEEKNIKKMCRFKKESGRSMIEMLGVLAIIGVLSIGAIAGYSKAMEKYKLNKQAEQLTQIISGIIKYKSIFSSLTPNESLIPIYKKLNFIPKEMIKDNSNTIYDVFNTSINILRDPDKNLKNIWVQFLFTGNKNIDSCRNIANTAREYHADLASFGIHGRISNDEKNESWFYNDTKELCYKDGHCIRTMDLTAIQNLCDTCLNQQSCSIYYMFGF